MKKLTVISLSLILVGILLLMFACAKKEEHSDDSSSGSSQSYSVSGYVQKGPYVQGTEITVRELDSSMTPSGRTFTGTIDDNTGTFSAKGDLSSPYVELSADGYYFNEVSGSLSTAKLTLSALSVLTDSSSVNVNLMTHLEKKRVEYLIGTGLSFSAAKSQAQAEIMKMFNIDNVTLGNSETLDISKSGDGNAVLLAISAILQSDKTEAQLTELLSTINTDIRTDGTLDSTNTKTTLLTAVDYIMERHSTIRTNIESRYNSLGISATIPAFESYAFKLNTTTPFVAVGNGGIYTSSNGTSWTQRSSTACSGVTYGNNTFVAVGGSGTILTSSTETSSAPYDWTSRTSGTSSGLNEITYGNGIFVAVGSAGTIITSTDGITWTSRTSPHSNGINDVTYENSTFVAVGGTGNIITSSDGISWTSRTSNTSQELYGVKYGNSTFVVVGNSGTVLTSSDGTTWTSRTSATNANWEGGVTYGNSLFVAVGVGGKMQTSSDGITWTERDSKIPTNAVIYAVTYGNNIFVALGSGSEGSTSSDGINWTAGSGSGVMYDVTTAQ